MAELDFEHGLAVLDRRTRWVERAILLYVVVSLVSLIAGWAEFSGLIDLAAEELTGTALAGSLVYLAFFLVYLVSVVLISMWIFRAHANLRAAGVLSPGISPGWAVGWFFIPLANLFKPFQAMRELWDASHAVPDARYQDSPRLLTLWWGFWIAGSIVTNISIRFQLSDEGTDAQKVGIALDALGTLLLLPAAWFLLGIVRQVNAAQRSTLAAASTFA